MIRRQFIRQIIRSAAIASTSAFAASKVVGANERVNVGLIGCGGRGLLVARLMRDVPNVQFIAVCDVGIVVSCSALAWGVYKRRSS